MGFKEKSAETSPGNSAITFPGNNAKTSPGSSARTYPVKSATMFPDNNVKTFLNKYVKMFPGNNAEMCQDKFVTKLDMAANSFFQIVDIYRERSLVIIASPISIMLYQSYVIFILMSIFGLKHNLVN